MTKNKLEKSVKDFLNSRQRMVIDEPTLEAFKLEIYAGIKSLNAEHSRCKPIELQYIKFAKWDNVDYKLEGLAFISFFIYKSNN